MPGYLYVYPYRLITASASEKSSCHTGQGLSKVINKLTMPHEHISTVSTRVLELSFM
jgi:hypothetical protein